MYDPITVAEKYRLAIETAVKEKPQGGMCGFELELNLLDSKLRPLLTVGSGPSQQSIVDYLRAEILPPWQSAYSQLEVFHWMIEWATRPYYTPRGAVYESRLMEATLLNALAKAGREFGERLYAWHGNLLYLTPVGKDSIPGSWHLAKRRYLERCVEMYGDSLATAGTHTNLSLPDPLLAWDFMHLPASERNGHTQSANFPQHFDEYKSQFYITATRLMRAFASLFIATSASTPIQSQVRDGNQVAVITDHDSVRNLVFPNPTLLDLPDLYRSYNDYLQISYDLVRRGIRFGNNNWTPVRARSFAEPVERLIAITSEQLTDLHARGLYAAGQSMSTGEMAQQIEMQNLMARINLPMARVEVRTDDGGNTLNIDIANLTLKHLLLIRFYVDGDFARAFRYDREDIARARRNEESAARDGLRAQIENPLTGKPISVREFLDWAISEMRPLAEALSLWEDLSPLVEMAAGAPNTAEKLREHLRHELGGEDVIPVELLRKLAEERQSQVQSDVEWIAETYPSLVGDATRLGEYLQHARDDVHPDAQAPIRFRPRPEALLEIAYPDKTSEILSLAQGLIRIPSVTASPDERLDEVRRAATFIFDFCRDRGLGVRYFDRDKYPALLIHFPGKPTTPVMFSGHFDVVAPDPDDSQFEPRIEGDYLLGRGAADMKTVVATYLIWMIDTLRQSTMHPPVNLLLVGNEENGEVEAMGTPHVLSFLAGESPSSEAHYAPRLLIAGERTGERGNELWGEICTQNRGVMRFNIVARGQRGHSGAQGVGGDLTERLLVARAGITGILSRYLTLSSEDGWASQIRFPFIQVGTPGVYNVTADYGLVGVEIRPIPQDDLHTLREELLAYCDSLDLELIVSVMENGVVCDPDNPYLIALINAVEQLSGQEPSIGRKLPGTSARFAPRGQGIVWGQSGLGPHAANERHFIPSIEPYYKALHEYGQRLIHRID
jgi:succinyl-diaminopimelate desuccinylase